MNTKARTGSYALITGAAGGLGSAYALEAVRRGWNLILVDLPGSGARELGERLGRSYRADVQAFLMDLADPADKERLVEWIGTGDSRSIS